MSSSVQVDALPTCNMCQLDHVQHPAKATVDGKTKGGPWAFMCDPCFDKHGIGLGTGKGQRLVLKEASSG